MAAIISAAKLAVFADDDDRPDLPFDDLPFDELEANMLPPTTFGKFAGGGGGDLGPDDALFDSAGTLILPLGKRPSK